jgi:NAD(P)-dependent dehydrogenase (short-subunit alcohol dehydrogenase family)
MSASGGELHKLFDLRDRTAWVGGGRGLGLQIAEALGELGARVVLTARKCPELDHAVGHFGRVGDRGTRSGMRSLLAGQYCSLCRLTQREQ